MKKKTALVLEGGGLRGAYTAGALSWLIDNGIVFDNAYGISTGAVYLSTYLLGSKENLKYFSTDGITDKRIIGLKPLLRCVQTPPIAPKSNIIQNGMFIKDATLSPLNWTSHNRQNGWKLL